MTVTPGIRTENLIFIILRVFAIFVYVYYIIARSTALLQFLSASLYVSKRGAY